MSFWDFIKNFITNNKKDARFITKTLVKTYGEPDPLEVGLYDKNTPIANEEIGIEVNGKRYIRTTDNDGIARLNINLGAGNYTPKLYWRGINGEYNSVTGYVDIIVDPQPEPEPEQPEEPTQLWDYFTNQGGGYLGQKTGYTCGPHSLMQCIHRLTGEDVSEMTLASVCGTTTDGTDHDGLATGLAWFNREYGYNLKMEWKNFSEVGFEGTQELIDNGACFHHILYRNQWGHYEVPKWTAYDPIYVLNSLGDSCGDGYCGYIEERSRSEHQSYINGISQKSVCIITRG